MSCGHSEWHKMGCATCWGYGMWPDMTAPMGPLDASDGMATAACPECGANPNPSAAEVANEPIYAKLEAIRQAVEAKDTTDYAPLLAVVRQPNPFWGNTNLQDGGYITRSWDGLPPGALAGALSLAIWISPLKIYIDVVNLLNEGDPDDAACNAVLMALGAVVPDAD